MTVSWNRHNWLKYSVLISEDRDYFYPADSTFDHSDFSWREFVHEFIPLLRNWLGTTQNEFPTLLAETASCLKKLHKICDHIYKDIQTLLFSAQFNDLDEIIKYSRDKDELIKYLRDKDYFDPVIYHSCSRLKKNSLNYQKRIHEFQKNLLDIKKKFPGNKKIFFDLDEKNNLFNKENVLLSFSSLI